MLSFTVSFYLFYFLLFASSFLALLLLITYQRQSQNLLLRSCCILILAMYAIILIGHLQADAFEENVGSFCEYQAIFLNYCYICVHAHAAFMMFNNCYIVMGWRWRIFEGAHENAYGSSVGSGGRRDGDGDVFGREATLVLVALITPLASLFLILLQLIIRKDTSAIVKGAFFCHVLKPQFWISTFWFVAFSVPGSLLAIYLLYKTWKARQRMLLYGHNTQLTIDYLMRLSLCTFVYLCLALGSFIPLSFTPTVPLQQQQQASGGFSLSQHSSEVFPSVFVRLPWNNPAMCMHKPSSSILAYYYNQFCPGALSFFPVYLGIALFLMYGFGTHARESYRKMLGCCISSHTDDGNDHLPDCPEMKDGQKMQQQDCLKQREANKHYNGKRRNSTAPILSDDSAANSDLEHDTKVTHYFRGTASLKSTLMEPIFENDDDDNKDIDSHTATKADFVG